MDEMLDMNAAAHGKERAGERFGPAARRDLPPVHVLGLGLPGPARQALLQLPLVLRAEVLVAGAPLLAELKGHQGQKLRVDADLPGLISALRRNREAGKSQTVLCSGDPLFFGLGARLAAELGPEALILHPGLSSLQAAAALLGRPWQHIRAVSLHGRDDYLPLAHALMAGAPVFLLTDAAHTAASIAAWLRERGLEVPALHLLEDLRQEPDGRVCAARCLSLDLDAALALPDSRPGALKALLIEPWPGASRPCLGLPDEAFVRDRGLLTRLPVRAAALALLGIEAGNRVWDLGSGSGALSVEAAFLAREGSVLAVERHKDRLEHMAENRRRFGAANMEILAGDMPGCLPGFQSGSPYGGQPAARPGSESGGNAAGIWSGQPRPDRIFIGGGLCGGAGQEDRQGGRPKGLERENDEDRDAAIVNRVFAEDLGAEIVRRAWAALAPGGRLLCSCVLLGSLERSRALLTALGAELSVTCVQASCSAELGGDLRLEALNPVFLVLAVKKKE